MTFPGAELLNKNVAAGYQPYQRPSSIEKVASLYFEQFGPGLQSLRRDLDPQTFSSIFSPKELAYEQQRLKDKREKYAGDKTEYGQEAEVVFLQMLRDYKLLGKDARIIPTSEFDDEIPGIDFIIEFPLKNGAIIRLGIDTTTTEDRQKIDQKERGGLQKTRDSDGDQFSYCDGVARKALFFRSDAYPGTYQTNNKTKRGVLIPLIVVQLKRNEIDTYLSGIYNGNEHSLRSTRQCSNRKEVVESGILILQRMLDGIASQLHRLGLANPLALFPEERALNAEMTSHLQILQKCVRQSLAEYKHMHPQPLSESELRNEYDHANTAMETIKKIHGNIAAALRDIKQKNPTLSFSLKSLYQAFTTDNLEAFNALSIVLRDAKGSSRLFNIMPFGKPSSQHTKKLQESYRQHFTSLQGLLHDERFKQKLQQNDVTALRIQSAAERLLNQREFFEFLSDYLAADIE